MRTRFSYMRIGPRGRTRPLCTAPPAVTVATARRGRRGIPQTMRVGTALTPHWQKHGESPKAFPTCLSAANANAFNVSSSPACAGSREGALLSAILLLPLGPICTPYRLKSRDLRHREMWRRMPPPGKRFSSSAMRSSRREFAH